MTRDEHLRALIAEGKTFAEAGKLYGLSRQRVHQIVGANNRKKKDVAAQVNKIVQALDTITEMHENGYTLTEIAEKVGIGARVIQRELQLPRRPKRIPHGTQNGYNRGCRCPECVAGHNTYHVELIYQRRRKMGVPERGPQHRRGLLDALRMSEKRDK